jgi:putative Holliday junction resolvase
MKYLGIDYGTKKAGLAVSDGKLADPLTVLRFENEEELIKKVNNIIQREKIEKVVVGVSENEMGKKSKEFAKKINSVTFDETLTSKDAINYAILAGVPKQKRRKNEDAYAATIMLQNYLDSSSLDI